MTNVECHVFLYVCVQCTCTCLYSVHELCVHVHVGVGTCTVAQFLSLSQQQQQNPIIAHTCYNRGGVRTVGLSRVRKRLVLNLPPCHVAAVQQQPADGQLTARGKGLVCDKNEA